VRAAGGEHIAAGKSCDVSGGGETVGTLAGLRRPLLLAPLLRPVSATLLLRDLRRKLLENGLLAPDERGETFVGVSVESGRRVDIGDSGGGTGTEAPRALIGLHVGQSLLDLAWPHRAQRMVPGGSRPAAEPLPPSPHDHEKVRGTMAGANGYNCVAMRGSGFLL